MPIVALAQLRARSAHRHGLHVLDQLLKYFAPSLTESHFLVRLGVLPGGMDGRGGVLASTMAVRFERELALVPLIHSAHSRRSRREI